MLRGKYSPEPKVTSEVSEADVLSFLALLPLLCILFLDPSSSASLAVRLPKLCRYTKCPGRRPVEAFTVRVKDEAPPPAVIWFTAVTKVAV